MNIEEIRRKFNIAADDLDGIKDELKKKICEKHPDNNPDKSDDYVQELNAALDFVRNLQKEKKQMVVPVDDILRALSEVFRDNKKQEIVEIETLNKRLAENIEYHNKSAKRSGAVRRWTSTFVFGILTFLWAFPKEIFDHPVLQLFWKNIDTSEYVMFSFFILLIWLYLMAFTISLWIQTLKMENIEKNLIDKLKSESIQNRLFISFTEKECKDDKFSKSFFMDYIYRKMTIENYEKMSKEIEDIFYIYSERSFFGFSTYQIYKVRKKLQVDDELLQSTADIILLRALEKGLIEKVRSNSLIDEYKLIHHNDEEK